MSETEGIICVFVLFVVPFLVYMFMEWDLKRLYKKAQKEAMKQTKEYMDQFDKRFK